MFDLDDELTRLRDRLEDAGIAYTLCGGLAMGVHGHPRATVDIDILIRPADEPEVEAIARELGYAIKAHPMTFSGGATEIRRISKIDPGDGETLMLNLLLYPDCGVCLGIAAAGPVEGERARCGVSRGPHRAENPAIEQTGHGRHRAAARGDMKPVDYSDRAITMRIRQVSQLRRLCLSLARATPVRPAPVPPLPPPSKPQPC